MPISSPSQVRGSVSSRSSMSTTWQHTRIRLTQQRTSSRRGCMRSMPSGTRRAFTSTRPSLTKFPSGLSARATPRWAKVQRDTNDVDQAVPRVGALPLGLRSQAQPAAHPQSEAGARPCRRAAVRVRVQARWRRLQGARAVGSRAQPDDVG